MAKLTDIPEKAAAPSGNYLVHVVDPADTTDDPAGTSFRMTVANLVGAFLASLGVYYTKTETDGLLATKANTSHTHEISAVTGLQSALDAKINAGQKGQANGVAELDSSGRVPATQLPSFVDDVIEAADFASLPSSGEAGKIYLTLNNNRTFRWSGSTYVEISASLALGETDATAYRGDRGAEMYAIRHTHSNKSILDAIQEAFTSSLKTAYDATVSWIGANGASVLAHIGRTDNPHGVTKAQVGLANADNTSDLNKPISTATQAALNGKANTVHTHTASQVTDFNTAADARVASGVAAHVADADPHPQYAESANLGPVAFSNDYNDLDNRPDLSIYDNFDDYPNLAGFPATGASGVIYLARDTGYLYRWNGSGYSQMSAQLALGETPDTAYRGDRGKIAYDHSQITSGNPHGTTKADLGLGNVDNTSDASKPISTAMAAALADKANATHGHTALEIAYTPVDPFYLSADTVQGALLNTQDHLAFLYNEVGNISVISSFVNSFLVEYPTIDDFPTGPSADNPFVLIYKANLTQILYIWDGTTYREIGTSAADALVAANGMGVVVHGDTASIERPTGFAQIHWIGSVEPTNMANGDIWSQT